MGKPIDMAGLKYGRLTVIEMAGHNHHKQRQWRCTCDCGNLVEKTGSDIRNGNTLSCGCLATEFRSQFGTLTNKAHGMSKSQIWSIHRSMMDRCYLPTSHAYSRYGGRGITVCERWHNFENFYADMGDKPKGMSLDRIDNNGEYSPVNVKWATTKEQANNRSSSKFIEHDGKRMTITQWAEYAGIEMRTLWSRLRLGIAMPEALENRDRRYSI